MISEAQLREEFGDEEAERWIEDRRMVAKEEPWVYATEADVPMDLVDDVPF